jgi:hypothetical protein
MAATLTFYLERAAEAGRDADEATLDNVRDRARRSEAAWLDMARRVERAQQGRAQNEAAKTAAEDADA